MKNTKYVCIEGTEGCFKTTNTISLANFLKAQGYSVLVTKEPGCEHAPVTLEMRKLILDASYSEDITLNAREYINQAVRSINLEKVVKPNLGKVDFIIQDRGLLSGYAYGEACGHYMSWLRALATKTIYGAGFTNLLTAESIYDHVIVLDRDPSQALDEAVSSKQEYINGDAIESRGKDFMLTVYENMRRHSNLFNSCIIDVSSKTKNQVLEEIVLKILGAS